MSFYIEVYSGLNNKLLPLLSLLRIARKENKKIKCFWGQDAYIYKSIFSFTDLFETIQDISFISPIEYKTAYNNPSYTLYNKYGSDRDRKEIIYKPGSNNSVFYRIVHLISYSNDNVVGNYVPYPRAKKICSPFIEELKLIVQELVPKKNIMDKINKTVETFNNYNVLGLHIRTTDGGFTDIPVNKVFSCIESYLAQNSNNKIYISCDNIRLEKDIISKFSSNIIYFEDPFGNNYSDKCNRHTFGTKNAVCEMFILSKCNSFLGTPGSSFSFMTWLLRDDKEFNFWCDNPWL